MKKTHEDEFNLLGLLLTLWRKKYTLFFITSISFIFGIFYSFNQPVSYKVSTPVNYGKDSLFIKYRAINEVLKENESLLIENELDSYLVDAKSIFKKFIIEFQDYEEMIVTLKNDKSVNNLIKDLKESDQRKLLISIAKSFILSKNSKNLNYTLSLTWPNEVEGKLLFREALLLTLKNVKNALINDVRLLAVTMDKKNSRLIQTLKNQISLIEHSTKLEVDKRIQFLKEQSIIAKELGIEGNLSVYHSNVHANRVKIMPSNTESIQNPINFDAEYFLAFDNNFNNLPYYLRGYKAIQKELEIVNSRSKEDHLLRSSGFIYLNKKLLALKKNNPSDKLRSIADDIKNDDSDKWVYFNFDLADTKIHNKKFIYLTLSLIIGFILGLIYIIIHTNITKTPLSKETN